jgi:hypothetical protein
VKRLVLAVLALAVIVTMSGSAQSGVPVKNVLVVVSAQDDIVLQLMLDAGGSPSSVLKALETAENQTHTTVTVEHEHDLLEITIQGATVVPEFPLPAVLAAAGIAAALVWKRRLRR